MSPERERAVFKMSFNDTLLASVILLMLTCAAMIIGLYVLPREPLLVAAAQPTIRISQAASFPVGASRVTNWGDQIVIVVRRDADRFAALQGVSPSDGCILRWDAVSSRLFSPCSYVEYDLQGNVITGLSRTPLRRYVGFVRDGAVYVTD